MLKRTDRLDLLRCATALMALGIVLIIGLANRGFNEGVLAAMRSVPDLDKLLHFLLFGFMAYLLNASYPARSVVVKGRHLLFGSVVVMLFCIAEECSQIMFEARTFSLADLGADMLGIGLASMVSRR